jgi:hypothetical protein
MLEISSIDSHAEWPLFSWEECNYQETFLQYVLQLTYGVPITQKTHY